MHENSINFLLVENDEKKIMGIITESSLLEIVSRNSFKETVKNNITKVKKIDYQLPLGESLKDVVYRVSSTLKNILESAINSKILVVAHGNSIRAMVKILDNLTDSEIVDVNITTGIPLAYNIN